MLHITEGKDNLCLLFVWLMCLYLDGSVKGCFVLLSSCIGHLVLALHEHQILNVLFTSSKKKELFNVKEAHNHSFSHVVCGFTRFPRPSLTGAQTANWGWYYNLDQTSDKLELTLLKGAVCAQRRSVLYKKYGQGQRCFRDHLYDQLDPWTTDPIPVDPQISCSKGPARISRPAPR